MVTIMRRSRDHAVLRRGHAVLLIAAVAVIGALGMVSPVMAQRVAPPGPGSPGPGEGRRLIETIKLWKMTEALELTEDQAARLFPRLTQLEASRREFHVRQRALRDELAELLRQRPLRDQDIRMRLEELDRSEVDFKGRERAVKADIRSILSLEQQARLTLFEDRFETEMRRTIQDLRQRRQGLFPPYPRGQGVGPPPVRNRPMPVEGPPPQ